MFELIEKFIGKECIIYAYNTQVVGIISEVTEGAIIVTAKDNTKEIVNLDFIIRIREYPLKKNGKKRQII